MREDMIRRMLYSLGLLLSLSLICQSITDIRNVQATEFDELTEEQKDAAMALLKQAVSESNVDPLELIRKGMEKVKEEQEKMMMNDEPQSESESTTSEPPVSPSTSSAVESSSSAPTTEQSSTARPEEVGPERAPAIDAPEAAPPSLVTTIETSSIARPDPETTVADLIQPSSSESFAPNEPVPNLSTSSTTSAPVETEPTVQPSEPTPAAVNNNQQDQSDQQERAKDVAADQTTTSAPVDGNFENVYIDESDPNDPKQVHVKNRTKSKVDDNGFSHEHEESVSSTSLGNNPNSFSKHSSSFSSSGSSSAFVNGKPVKPIKWTYSTMKPFAAIPPVPRIPRIPPISGMATMPPMPPMPIMSFGSMMPPTWPGYYGQNYEDYGGYPVQASTYASAYAGLPENFFGPSNGGMSRRQAKKLARKQERAARRAQEFEFYQ